MPRQGLLEYSDSRVSKVTVSGKMSPSLLFNNLGTGNGKITYIHDFQVVQVAESVALGGKDVTASEVCAAAGIPSRDPQPQASYIDASALFTAKRCSLQGAQFLVVATSGGVNIYDAPGQRPVSSHAGPSSKKPDGQDRPAFCRGACVVASGDGDQQICVGTSTGGIMVFNYAGGKFRLATTLTGHNAPVTVLTSELDGYCGQVPTDAPPLTHELISGDDRGSIIVWDATSFGSYGKAFSFDAAVLGPVAGLAARGQTLVAGFNSGVIRFYSLAQRRLWMEVQAHSRFLSSLAIHPWRPMFATAAEDATVHVWELPEPGDQTQVLLSGAWVDQLVTGVAFCGEGSDVLVAAAYDCDDLRIWQPAPKAA